MMHRPVLLAPPTTPLIRARPIASVAQYNGVWHCFVGRNFGAYMTHEQVRARR